MSSKSMSSKSMSTEHFGFNPTYSEHEPSIEQVKALAGDTILEFGAPWCGHCLAAEPFVKETLTKRSPIRHVKVSDGIGKPLGRAYQVKLWPTLILVRNGEEVTRIVRPTNANETLELFSH